MITDKVARTPSPSSSLDGSSAADASAAAASAVEDAYGSAATPDVSWLWSSTAKPSIHSCAPHRVFVTWSADGGAPAPTVHVMQLDPLAYPLAAAALCGGGLDTRIPSRDVLDIKRVSTVLRGMDDDGYVCAVLRGRYVYGLLTVQCGGYHVMVVIDWSVYALL